MRKIFSLFTSVFLVAVLSGCLPVVMSAVSTTEPSKQPSLEPTPSNGIFGIEKEIPLVDDEYIGAVFLEAYEEPWIQGVFYLRIRVENKSDREIWVALSDVSVNKMSTIATSGIPMEIQPGNSSKTPFIISYSNLDISAVDELQNISFRFWIMDGNSTAVLEETDIVSIDF